MTTVDKILAGSAVLGGALFAVRLVLFFLGGAGMDTGGDLHVDVGGGVEVGHGGEPGDTDVSFRLLSFQGVTAFLMMFGLVGLALRKESRAGESLAILGGFAAGLGAMWAIAKVFAMLKSLQSSGTLDMRNAVGQTGSVYLTIASGSVGKVQVAVQGRLMVLNASAAGGGDIKTGQPVRVVDVREDGVLIVERVNGG